MSTSIQSLDKEVLGTSVGTHGAQSLLQGFASGGDSQVDDHGLLLAAARKVCPFETIADWTHQLPKSPTDFWMDRMGRDQFHHRWKGHHLFDDGWKALNDSHLSLTDFTKHLSLDVITISGIPLLTTTQMHFLRDALGISVHKMMPWVSQNVFDLSIGAVTTYQSISDLHLAFTGHLEWGTRTAILTFGSGVAETVFGVSTQNPFCVLAGLGEFLAGGVSFCDYYSQPFVFGVPLSEILTGIGCGAASGLVCSALAAGLTWNTTTRNQKARLALKNTALGTVIGGLAAITPWLSVPASTGWALGNFAVHLARQQRLLLRNHRLSSPWSLRAALLEMVQQRGCDETRAWLQEQLQPHRYLGFEKFNDKARKKVGAWNRRREALARRLIPPPQPIGDRAFRRQISAKTVQ